MRIAILGRTKILYDTIRVLKNAGHEIVIIGTCKATPEYEVDENGFEKMAKEMQVPFLIMLTLPSPILLI